MERGGLGTSSTASGITGGDNGFFSNILAGLEEGIRKIGSEVLPVWAAQQLDLESYDQLYDPTFYAAAAQNRLSDPVTTQGAQTTAPGFLNKPILSIGGSSLTGTTVLMIAGGLVLLAFVGKKLF